MKRRGWEALGLSSLVRLAVAAAFLVCAGASTADEAAPSDTPSQAARPNTRTWRATQKTPAQRIDARVRMLTTALDLNANQRATLRELLVKQREQLLRLRTEGPPHGDDRMGAIKAILGRTGDQIRAMLNDDQRRKYIAEVPHSLTSDAQVDVDHWIRLTSPKAQREPGASQ